ncbi:hypothetical protein MNV49_006495 [Pseudohyphozyma bogoriensis]|nr:hypothetical protein MNV49_006495 [Pseudohyphozyma bogoriensis]
MNPSQTSTNPSAPPKLVYDTKTYLTLSLATSPSALSLATQHALQPSGDDSDELDSPSSLAHSQHSSSSQTSTSSSSSSLRSALEYVGPVGALEGEHIYSLPVPTTNPPKPEVKDVKQWLEGQDGVQAVEVMVPKQRASRKVGY